MIKKKSGMLWKWFLAYHHINDKAVCEMSVGRNKFNDYHDYRDAKEGAPMHFFTYKCERCGKEFVI